MDLSVRLRAGWYQSAPCAGWLASERALCRLAGMTEPYAGWLGWLASEHALCGQAGMTARPMRAGWQERAPYAGGLVREAVSASRAFKSSLPLLSRSLTSPGLSSPICILRTSRVASGLRSSPLTFFSPVPGGAWGGGAAGQQGGFSKWVVRGALVSGS